MRYLLYMLLFTLTLGCGVQRKTVKILTSGSVQQQNFYKEFSFEYVNQWIFVTADIEGLDQPLTFLLDTGAPNVLQPKYAQILGLKNIAEERVGSSTTQRKKVPFSKIDKISIAGIDFIETGVLIIPFDQSPDMICLGKKIDGIIGSNLMRNAIWQINYQTKKIIITDQKDKLEIGQIQIPMTLKTQGTPKVAGSVNEQIIDFTIDTGKSGGIALHTKHKKNNKLVDKGKVVKGVGVVGSGIFGAQKDTLYKAMVKSMNWGDLNLDNTVVTYKKSNSNLVGNKFLENFILTLDWSNEYIYLSPTAEKLNIQTFDSFGFGTEWKENQLLVSLLYENSPAAQAGIKIGDQIVSIADKNFENIILDAYCDLKEVGLYEEGTSTIDVKWKRGEQVFEGLLNKQVLIK